MLSNRYWEKLGRYNWFARRALAPIRAALKSARDRWDEDRDGEGTQLRFREKPNARWAGYCLKGVQKARQSRRKLTSHHGSPRVRVAGFEGNALTVSEDLKDEADALYAKWH